MTNNDEKIRTQILNAMAKQGLRQAPLARRLGITPQSLNQVIKGERAVLPSSLTAILDELGLELTVQEKEGEGIVGSLDQEILLASGTADLQEALDNFESYLPPGKVDTWLETFQTVGASPNRYARRNIVLVQFDHPAGRRRKGRVRPCVIVTDARKVRESRTPLMYGIVPLSPRSMAAVGQLAPRFKASEGGLPSDAMALCAYVRTVAPERIVGFVGELDEMTIIERGLQWLFDIDWVMPENWRTRAVRDLLQSEKTGSELKHDIAKLYGIEMPDDLPDDQPKP